MTGLSHGAPGSLDQADPRQSETGDSTVTPRLRVLVVDNESRFLEMITGLLQIDGHHVITAVEAAQALSIVERDHLDVAVVDFSMPLMNGWDLAEALRQRQPGLGIILCTGWGREITAAFAERDYVDVILAKPFRLADLRRALKDTAEHVARRQGQPGLPTAPPADH